MASSASAHRVLIVDNDARVRHALEELLNATDGFSVIAADAGDDTAASTPDAAVAVVVLGSGTDHEGIQRIRALAEQMPVVAVSAAGSAADAAIRAGAAVFCEMDGNADALIDALTLACRT